MRKVKIVKTITHSAYQMAHCGVGYSVYQGYNLDVHDHVDHVEQIWVKEFELPDGFSLAKNKAGTLCIWHGNDYTILDFDDKGVFLISSKNGKSYRLNQDL